MAKGIAWSVLGLAIFSGWFVVTRLVVVADLRLWDVVALRYAGGALVTLPMLLTRCRHLPRRAWFEGLVLTMLWGAPFVVLVAYGLRTTSAADAAALAPGLMPVFAGLFAWLLRGERPLPRRLIGYGLIVAGMVLLASGAAANFWGFAALVLAAAMWAGYTIRFPRTGLDAMQAVAMVCFFSALLYLPAFFLSGGSHLAAASLREFVFQAFYQGVLMSFLAILAFNRAVALLGPLVAAVIPALIPVIATVEAASPLLGERQPLLAWVAVVAVSAGVFLAAAPSRRARTRGVPSVLTKAAP